MNLTETDSDIGVYKFKAMKPYHFLFLVVIASSLCLYSCENEMEQPDSTLQMSFSVDVSSTGAQSEDSFTDTPQDTMLQVADGKSALYLHTIYTDGFSIPKTDGDAATRAATIATGSMYDSFGLTAFCYTDSWNNSLQPYFHDVTVSRSGEGHYETPTTYYWPGASYNMRFFAYAPKGNSYYVFSSKDQTGAPTLTVTVPSDVAQQEDLLVADSKELKGDHNTSLPLTFNHAMTAVRFVCGDDMQAGTIKSISLKNVYSKGVYDLAAQSWTMDTPASFSQTLDKVTTGTAGEALTAAAQTFMMIPQTLPEGATFEMVFTDDSGTDRTLTADIKGQDWPMGKIVTYKISTSSINWTYTLAVTAPSADYEYTGGTQQYTVTSYKSRTNGTQEAVAWTTEYSVDGGTIWTTDLPDWLSLTTSGEGGTTATSYDATVVAQTATSDNTHTAALQAATAQGTSSSPYNLANQTDGGSTNENTANCYVVGAPGYYSFPLVYGNAIKNSATNSEAYTHSTDWWSYIFGGGSNYKNKVLSTFINHAGNSITDPYIANNKGCSPSSAELLWQDALNLVTDIKYNSGTNGGNISFKVDKSTICQGNAVIAIKDEGGNILWSWHIWVTDEDISNAISVSSSNNGSSTYNFMPVNLGWCDASTQNYAERSCLVKFTSGSKSQTITIKQTEAVVTTAQGNSPYYSWGRKDPFCASDGTTSNATKTWYDAAGNSSTSNPSTSNFGTGTDCIKNYILNPTTMHSSQEGDNKYYNLWSADYAGRQSSSSSSTVIKTIYDPSPVGFELPNTNSCSAFSTSKGEWEDNKGWNFYTTTSKNATIFFPASGYRNNSDISSVGTNGYYWLATPTSNKNGGNSWGGGNNNSNCSYGYAFTFSSSKVNTSTTDYKAKGFSIRPVKE